MFRFWRESGQMRLRLATASSESYYRQTGGDKESLLPPLFVTPDQLADESMHYFNRGTPECSILYLQHVRNLNCNLLSFLDFN